MQRKLLFRFSPPVSVLFLDSSVALWHPFFPPTSFWIFFSVPCASSSLSDLLVWNEEALGNYSTWGRSEMLRTVDLSQSASRSPHTIFYILLGIVGNTKALPSGSDLLWSVSKICIFTLTFEFLIIWPLFPWKTKDTFLFLYPFKGSFFYPEAIKAGLEMEK